MNINKLNVLDFTKLDQYNIRLVNNIAEKIRRGYVNYLVKIGKKHEKNIDWWMLNFVSRNTLLSPLFCNICYLKMLEERLERGNNYDEIVVNSLALKKVIKENSSKYNFKVTYNGKQSLFVNLGRFYSYCKIIIHFFLRWIFGWGTRFYSKKPMLNKSLILLDIFVLKNSFNKSFYNDRYYPKLLDYVNSNDKERIYYVPTYYGIRNYKKKFRDMRTSKQKFLLKEDYLKINDYFFSLLYPFRLKNMKIEKRKFMGFDISPLIKEEILNDGVSSSSMYSLLNYKFSKRLKDKGIKIKRIINWFENQSIDHGFNIGFRKFYPEADLIGYMGSPLNNNYLSLYPTEQERICAVIPKEINVIGRGYIDKVKKFCPDLKVKVAPAFRFTGVWNKRKYDSDKSKLTVLVALPILVSESDEIIDIVLEAARPIDIDNCLFQIKTHPTQNVERLKDKWEEKLTPRFEFVTGDFNLCVENANVLISCASSVCLETLAKGIPVIVIASKIGLTQMVIPNNLEQDIWRLCYTPREIRDAILFYLSRDNERVKKYKKIGNKIKKEFFEPVTRKNVKEFLGLK